MTIENLNVSIYADGADVDEIRESAADPLIAGFTTNPTLMRAAGVDNYRDFARQVLAVTGDRPVSFEVLADDLREMERQALEIATWGKHVQVKIPITTVRGETALPLVARLTAQGVVCNVTAMFTIDQVEEAVATLPKESSAILSLFAGRIADTGVDPLPIMREAVEIASSHPDVAILWASPRETLNIFQADEVGCEIITCTRNLRAKFPIIGKPLDTYSRETVEMFFHDAEAADYEV
ncbi:transaldolase [Gemmatimonas sp.]|uniref:transaldolase n=1 Tax=Gemmatimonas sp. TaxID=1962908 RepID=UPI003562165F